ncbi:HNH endonuclease [Bacterioplanoides sp.]|uniref:HNH endonuclease n=1 Tax=Bacterioplanoides sp. TaxID=2066072 RepID=UPI003B5A7088
MDIDRSTLRPIIEDELERRTWVLVENSYTTSANQGNLTTLHRCNVGTNQNPQGVLGSLTKSNMIALYEDYFRKKTEPRAIYDSIQNLAEDECPYCAGLSSDVDTLDHYLPKKVYPRFSILPVNLVPSCSSCNRIMQAASSDELGEQFLHPYTDADHFFQNQWLFATYNMGAGDLEYFVDPPDSWNEDDKRRVDYHFRELELEQRLRKRAEREVAGGIRLFEKYRERNPSLTIQEAIDDAFSVWIEVEFVNHWKRVAYLALAEAVLAC